MPTIVDIKLSYNISNQKKIKTKRKESITYDSIHNTASPLNQYQENIDQIN